MNEKQAKQIALENNLSVSSTKITKLENRFVWGRQAKRYEIKIGNIVCFYETDKGGCACWYVDFNNQTDRIGYKSDAIMKAVELQLN